MKKGVSPLVSGTMFILITVIIATLVAGWLTTVSNERSSELQNTTQEKLRCQNADLFINKLYYDCNMNCFTGIPYKIDANMRNSGSLLLQFSKLNLIFNNGNIIRLDSPTHDISAGEVDTFGFNSIMITSDPPIPGALAQTPPMLDTDTLMLLHFNEGSGDVVYDTSPHGNNGTIIGPTWISGLFGNALNFQDSDHRIIVPSSTLFNSITNELTVEAWINPETATMDNIGIVCRGVFNNEQFCLHISRQTVIFFVRDNFGNKYEVPSNTEVGIGDWSHVAGVYNSQDNRMEIYVNGEITIGDSNTRNVRLLTNDILIGNIESALGGPSVGFEGGIDEVKISNISKSFTSPGAIDSIDLIIDVSYPNINFVRLYDESENLITEYDVGGANNFNVVLEDIEITNYRVVVESDKIIEKWYPCSPESNCLENCIDTSIIDKANIISINCPGTGFDSIPVNEFEFINCI
ncbi:LamG domain-containing protein [Candidatus Aenigmatarchaeota archaeon]